MKWWGWGNPEVRFDPVLRPDFWPFVQEQIGIDREIVPEPPVELDSISLPPPRRNDGFTAALPAALTLHSDRLERLLHASGKSFTDLWRLRHGIVPAAPDAVIYPGSEDDVVAIILAATTHGVIIVPFGGGSNIAGCLNTDPTEDRMVVSLDMRRLNRVTEIDPDSLTARCEAGIFGPELERQLGAAGMTLGHFPDSFLHSTLGGWIATRSAGMQSDRYGKIEDMVLSLRMVTPTGTIETKSAPRASNGIDIDRLCIGSEGTLGVITEATIQLHRRAPERALRAYLFRDFAQGVEAIRQSAQSPDPPSMTRLNDPAKTALSSAFRARQSRWEGFLTVMFKTYLRHIRGLDLDRSCLLLATFEGDRATVRRQMKEAGKLYRRFGGVALGSAPGKAFEAAKYDFPHLRDFLLDRGIIADVSETATTWSNVLPLYRGVTAKIASAIAATGVKPWVGCHIGHSYRSGACLYFSFSGVLRLDDPLGQYRQVKAAAQDAMQAHGGTLSHHHSVGTEHVRGLVADISATGLRAVHALKHGLDPDGIMNPGRFRVD